MKKETTFDDVKNIAADAKRIIQHSIDSYSQLGVGMSLQQLDTFSEGQHAWLAELMKAIIESGPVQKGQTITKDGNFNKDVKVEATQGSQDMSLDIKMYGRDDNHTKQIAACFWGGEAPTKNGIIVIDKETIDTKTLAEKAAEKLVAYFTKEYIKKNGGDK